MEISYVVAMSENNVIGRDGGLPWRLSTDLKRFKALTMGKPMLMGRVCYDSIGKPLPGRPNIVVTRNPAFGPDGVIVAHSLAEGMAFGRSEAERLGVDEVAIIGGGVIYREAFDLATVLHVTHVEAHIEGDTFFPEIDPAVWQAGEPEFVPSGEKDDYPTRFVTYRRKT